MEQREIDNMLLSMIQKHFPSLPLSDEYTDWGKWLGFARAVYESGRASPASVPEGFNHSIGADRFTTVRGTYWWHVRAGDGTQNIGKFHTKLAAEDMELTLLTAFRDGAFMQYGAMLGSAPTPPVSECVDPVMTKEELIAAAESIGMRFPGASIPPVSEDRKDAERYRWLRSSSTGPSQIWELLSDDCQPPILTLKSMGDLDAAIDAAMEGK